MAFISATRARISISCASACRFISVFLASLSTGGTACVGAINVNTISTIMTRERIFVFISEWLNNCLLNQDNEETKLFEIVLAVFRIKHRWTGRRPVAQLVLNPCRSHFYYLT